MRRAVLVLSALLASACSSAPVTPSSSPVGKASALPQLLAVLACPQVDGRVLSLATGADGVLDAFAYVRHCAADPQQNDVALVGDAWAWVAVDRDLGAVRVRQFVHASVHASLVLGVSATYAREHLELALRPRPGAVATIEPVGALVVSPLDWASLLAVELAPAAGTSVEWVAKRRLQKETEAAMTAALAKPLVFAYDARRGETVPSAAAPAAEGVAVPRVRVVPRGTALFGPYAEASPKPDVHLRLEPGARVAVRVVCRSHAERILEADRRGDDVGLEDWTVVSGDTQVDLPPPPCPWILALRAVDDAGAIVATDVHGAHGDASARERDHRWVALDELTLQDGGVPVDLQIVMSTDVFRRFVVPRTKQLLPALFEVSGDEQVWIRAVRPGKDPSSPTVVARGRVPLDSLHAVDTVVALQGADGATVARVRVRARVEAAP